MSTFVISLYLDHLHHITYGLYASLKFVDYFSSFSVFISFKYQLLYF